MKMLDIEVEIATGLRRFDVNDWTFSTMIPEPRLILATRILKERLNLELRDAIELLRAEIRETFNIPSSENDIRAGIEEFRLRLRRR